MSNESSRKIQTPEEIRKSQTGKALEEVELIMARFADSTELRLVKDVIKKRIGYAVENTADLFRSR